jgi:adenosylcobinamide amidohydrolase
MKAIDLLRTPQAKLLVEDNVIAVTSDTGLLTVSSAIYNGGFKRVNAILNIQVPEGYGDAQLHDDPMHLVRVSAAKVHVQDNYLAMITAAKVSNRHYVAKTDGKTTVNVVATAGASHGESSGEPIDADHEVGTINVIVVINGNPTDSCLVASFLTATEAKTAALNDLDVRSRYNGEAATGSITDSLSVATTNTGPAIELGGPASKLGQLVSACVREAVREALQKQDGTYPSRPVVNRLKERQLPMEKLVAEMSKIKSLNMDEEALTAKLSNILTNPLYASFLLAAAKLDGDVKKGLIPSELSDIANVSEHFGSLTSKEKRKIRVELDDVDLPPFVKQTLFNILQREL